MLASYAEDNTVRVWDVNQGECAITFTGIDESCQAMRWSPDGDLLGCMVKNAITEGNLVVQKIFML